MHMAGYDHDCLTDIEKLGPGTKSKVQVQRRSLGLKHFTKFGLPTTTTHKLLDFAAGGLVNVSETILKTNRAALGYNAI